MKIKLLLALLFTAELATAHPLQPGNITYNNMSADMATTAALSNSNTSTNSATNSASNSALGGASSVKINTPRALPNAPAMGASSSNTTSLNRKLNQKTVSFLLGGFTSVNMDLDIVSFVQSNPSEEAKLAACVDSQDYRTFRKLLNAENSSVPTCPQDK